MRPQSGGPSRVAAEEGVMVVVAAVRAMVVVVVAAGVPPHLLELPIAGGDTACW